MPRGADQGEQRGEYRPSGPWGRGSATVSGSAAKDVRGVVGGLPLLMADRVDECVGEAVDRVA